MNTRERMYETNGKARKWLKENKFVDVHLFPHNRFCKDVHFQGLSFDGCASLEKRFVLFQIKTNEKPSKKIQEQMAIASKESSVVLIWMSIVKSQVQVWQY